jgi:hypothetical protein
MVIESRSARCLNWVKGSKTLSEYILSEVPQLADIVRATTIPACARRPAMPLPFSVCEEGPDPPGRACMWCGKGFALRINGGKPRVFSRPACRRAFDAAGRRWVAEAIACGTLTLDALRNSPPAKRALLPGAISPVPAPQRRAPAWPTSSCAHCSRCRARDGTRSPQRCPRSYSTGSSAGTLPAWGKTGRSFRATPSVIAARRSTGLE